MKELYFSGKSAEAIYRSVQNLPIIDYHCHLSPKEIFEDQKFDDLYQLWLSGDHYKWRLMRVCGIEESYITGDATPYEKYLAFVKAINLAPGNPLYHWVHAELDSVFGITEPLTEQNAEAVWKQTSDYCKANQLSARKLIKKFGVEYIATTDDCIDELSYHKKIQSDATFSVKVCPTFRLDNLLLALQRADVTYLTALQKVSGVTVCDGDSLIRALRQRLSVFISAGCTISDVGVAFFPHSIATEEKASATIADIFGGAVPSADTFDALQGWLYRKLFAIFAEQKIVLQLHTGVMRNASSRLFRLIGPDAGGDCIGNTVPIEDLRNLLDDLETENALPRTIIYTLSPVAYSAIATLIGAFPGVTLGAAWWFCDHLFGIREQLTVYSELSALGTFTGMLTDSRSFTSYVRHDYFRQILCDFLGEMVDKGQFPLSSAQKIAEKICYENPKNLI